MIALLTGDGTSRLSAFSWDRTSVSQVGSFIVTADSAQRTKDAAMTDQTPPPTNRPSKLKKALLASLALAVVATGIGAPAVVEALSQNPPPTKTQNHEASTVNSLAGDLAALGLELDVQPEPAPTDAIDGDTTGWSEDNGFDADNSGSAADAPLAAFKVSGDNLEVSDGTTKDSTQAKLIWQRFVQLIPADQRRQVIGFELMAKSYEGAHVYPSDADPSKWVLGVSLGLGSDDLDHTLVHEFGHLLTLQVKEVPPGGDPDSCATYFTGEGCALSGSTFARFVKSFWPPSLLDESNYIQATGDWDAAAIFYEDNRHSFVTEYATTNPAEDLAETFTAFVMQDRPSGATIADQKVQFLWNDPDMVTLRTQIRAGL